MNGDTPTDSPPPKDSHLLLTPAFLLSLNRVDYQPSCDSQVSMQSRESGEVSTEKQFSDLSRLAFPQKSSSASSVHMSFSNLSGKTHTVQRGEDDPITKSILDDISDHELLYSSAARKPSNVHRIGISLLTDVDFPKSLEMDAPNDSHKLGSLCCQFSSELRNTKEELFKLYQENRDLRGKLQSQEDHIRTLNDRYTAQTANMRRDIQELRQAIVHETRTPDFDELSSAPVSCQHSDPCCALF